MSEEEGTRDGPDVVDLTLEEERAGRERGLVSSRRLDFA